MDKREITKVEYGAEKANAIVLQFMSNAAEHIHSCVEARGAQVGVEQFKQASSEAKKRGIALKCITEINRENLEYCREILQTAELRHFAGIRGNFAVSESEYIATYSLSREDPPLAQVIYSNVEELVLQQQQIFDTLWVRAIPADMKIREMEQNAGGLKNIIDTAYVCMECAAFFIFKDDEQEHRKRTGHGQIREISFRDLDRAGQRR